MKSIRQGIHAEISEGVLVWISQASAAIFPLLISPFIVREFGLNTFGEYVMLLTIAQMGSVISEYSFSAIGPRLLAAIKATPLAARRERAIIFSDVCSNKGLLFPIGVIFFATLELAILKRPPTITDILGVLSLILGLAYQASWFLIATSQAMLLALSNLAGRILSGILIVSLIITKEQNPSLLFLATTIGIGLSGVISLFWNREPVRKFSLLLPKANLIRVSTPAFYGIVASALQNVMGQTLVGVFAGAAGAGVYAAVDRIARTISAGLKPLFMVMYPRMADLHSNSPNKASVVMNWSFAIWAVFAATSLSVCYLFGDRILIAIYGKEMAGGGQLFMIIIGWLCFGILNNIAGIQGLLASGRDHEYSFGMWIGVISTLIFAKIFAGVYDDIKGVAFAVLAGEVMVAVFFVFQFFKRKKGGVQC